MFLVNEGPKPKSRSEEKDVTAVKIDQMPTISEDIVLNANGRSNAEEAIFKNVAP